MPHSLDNFYFFTGSAPSDRTFASSVDGKVYQMDAAGPIDRSFAFWDFKTDCAVEISDICNTLTEKCPHETLKKYVKKITIYLAYDLPGS